MAHRSKKKHLKHVHEHEPATPPAKSPVAKADAAVAGIAKPRGNGKKRSSARRAPEMKATPKAPAKQKGLVRRLASKATNKITARPRKALSRARARVESRVKSLLGK